MENLKHEIKDTKGCGKRCHASRLMPPRVSSLTSHAQWPKVKLGDAPITIIDGDRGKNYPKQNELFASGYCLFLSAENVTRQGFRFDSNKFITIQKDSVLRNGKLARFDIILTTRGTLGNVALYGLSVPFENVRINSGMLILRCDTQKLLPNFLLYVLRSEDFISQVNGFKSGVAQPQLPIKDLKQIQIPLPPLPVQRRIADILSAYDDLIENNRRRIAILEETARLAYRKWFGGEDRSNEWEVYKVSEVLESFPRPKRVPKESYITDGAYPCIDQGKDFIGGYTNDEEAIVRRLPAIVFGDHTRVLKYVSEPFACGADGTQLLYAKDGVLTQSYLYCALKEIDLTNYFYARHFKILKSKEVFVPPYSIVKQFTDEVSCNLELISVLRKHGVKLAAARDMLLPRLMNNKLRKDA